MNDTLKYTRVAMLLHWVTVALVAALFVIGWTMTDLPRGPVRGETYALHKSIGITVFLLTLLRLWWRVRHRPPGLPETLPGWQRKLAHGVHHLFYLMLVAQPLLGYVSSSFTVYPTRYLGVSLPVWATPDPVLNELFSGLHAAGAVLLMGVIGVHVLGAVSHLVREGSGLLRRMLPW